MCIIYVYITFVRSVFEGQLRDVMPVVHTSIAGTRAIGRLVVGNSRGLLVPNSATDQVEAGSVFSRT